MRFKLSIPSIIYCLICVLEKSKSFSTLSLQKFGTTRVRPVQRGWVQDESGEWEWEEDDPNFVAPSIAVLDEAPPANEESNATPKLPSGALRPKQSLGQNFLRDPNTVAKIIRAFHQDATHGDEDASLDSIVELGPGAGALTDRLVATYGTDVLQCIEIDDRSIAILNEKHPKLLVHHSDVLQINYPEMAEEVGQPLKVIGNLPYYITSQILFALADASHFGAVDCATVTMQWEVGQRMVASTNCKDYGILSVIFQLYADVNCHFKIPPTVFYPQPKVDSALIGLHFLGPEKLQERLAGVRPEDLRRVVTTSFQQRRKTIRNSLKKLVKELCNGDTDKVKELFDSPPLPLPKKVQEAKDNGCSFAQTQELPDNWSSKRPEQLTSGQFVELTRRLFGSPDENEEAVVLGNKVWRKLKHGKNY